MRLVSDDVWAAMTIWAEARGEPYLGRLAVARVIRNRVARGWGHDVPAVVLQPYQFSCWNTQDPNRIQVARIDDQDEEMGGCVLAWSDSLVHDAGVGDAVMYYNPAGVTRVPVWATADKFVITIGHHEFYRG